jgi:hypothetical protein
MEQMAPHCQWPDTSSGNRIGPLPLLAHFTWLSHVAFSRTQFHRGIFVAHLAHANWNHNRSKSCFCQELRTGMTLARVSEAKGRFPIISSNLLESSAGSSKAYNMANCSRFLYFSSPFHDTLQMESMEYSLFQGWGCYFRGSHLCRVRGTGCRNSTLRSIVGSGDKNIF